MWERSSSGLNGEAGASGPALAESRADLSEPVESGRGCDNHGHWATEPVSACGDAEPATSELDARQSTPTDDESENLRPTFVWDENKPVADPYSRLGVILAASNDLFRPSTSICG